MSDADVRMALTTYDCLVEAGRRDANLTEVQPLLATPGGRILTSRYWNDLDERLWEFEKRKQDHNPIPDVLGLRCPHLALFGAADQLVAVPQSVQLFAEAACRPGRHQRFDLTVAVFPGADQRIRGPPAAALTQPAALPHSPPRALTQHAAPSHSPSTGCAKPHPLCQAPRAVPSPDALCQAPRAVPSPARCASTGADQLASTCAEQLASPGAEQLASPLPDQLVPTWLLRTAPGDHQSGRSGMKASPRSPSLTPST